MTEIWLNPDPGDNGPALQAAMDFLLETGGVIHLAAGEYRVNKPLVLDRSNVVLRGVGRGLTILSANQLQGQSVLVAGVHREPFGNGVRHPLPPYAFEPMVGGRNALRLHNRMIVAPWCGATFGMDWYGAARALTVDLYFIPWTLDGPQNLTLCGVHERSETPGPWRLTWGRATNKLGFAFALDDGSVAGVEAPFAAVLGTSVKVAVQVDLDLGLVVLWLDGVQRATTAFTPNRSFKRNFTSHLVVNSDSAKGNVCNPDADWSLLGLAVVARKEYLPGVDGSAWQRVDGADPNDPAHTYWRGDGSLQELARFRMGDAYDPKRLLTVETYGLDCTALFLDRAHGEIYANATGGIELRDLTLAGANGVGAGLLTGYEFHPYLESVELLGGAAGWGACNFGSTYNVHFDRCRLNPALVGIAGLESVFWLDTCEFDTGVAELMRLRRSSVSAHHCFGSGHAGTRCHVHLQAEDDAAWLHLKDFWVNNESYPTPTDAAIRVDAGNGIVDLNLENVRFERLGPGALPLRVTDSALKVNLHTVQCRGPGGSLWGVT